MINNEFSLMEDLSNELFVEIFSYLNGVDAVFAFSSLNDRFRNLLRKYCKAFDFKSKSKLQFDSAFEEYSTKNWKSLQLSNDDDTPGQIEYCFQNYPLTIYFTQLKSLSLLRIKPLDESVFFQLPSLTNLISLKLELVSVQSIPTFDSSNLKRLVVSSCLNIDWIHNFPQLESLKYTINNFSSDQTVLTWPSKLKHLKIVFAIAEHGNFVSQSLGNLSELISLEIEQREIGRSHPNGQLWEQLIRSSFPLLKKFKFCFRFPYWSSTPNEIDQIIASFSTPFYIDEKKWFVRCDISIKDQRAVLYSIPYAFDRFTISSSSFDGSILTYPNGKKNGMSRNIYKNVKTFVVESLSKFHGRSHGISTLDFINDYFKSIEQLHLLSMLSGRKTPDNMHNLSKKFCILLENTPHLYLLDIHLNDLQALTNNWTNISVCDHLSRKIRSLKLYADESSSQCFSTDILDQIIRVFVLECQHLSILIPLPIDTVVSLLRDMQQLYSLHINVIAKNDVKITMKWLEQQHIGLNYSNCLIVNHQQNYYFWLGKR